MWNLESEALSWITLEHCLLTGNMVATSMSLVRKKKEEEILVWNRKREFSSM